MKKQKTKFFGSIPLMVVLCLSVLMFFAIWTAILIVFLQGGNDVNSKETMLALLIVASIVLPLGIFVLIKEGIQWFSVFEVTEYGIKQSLCSFYKKEVKWSDVHEIRCYEMPNAMIFAPRQTNHVWLFVSKSNLGCMSYKKMKKQKDTISFYLTKQRLELIMSFTNISILNLPDWFENTSQNQR